MTDDQLDNAAAAALWGVSVASWRKYVSDGRAPKPDGKLGGSPWWRRQTVLDAKAKRPGQGAGGGRPRKVEG